MATKIRHVKAIIQLRRGTEEEWVRKDPVLHNGEPAFSTDIQRIKVGDGTAHWSELPYIDEREETNVRFVDGLDGVDGEEGVLYIDTVTNSGYRYEGENFIELESTSIDALKGRMSAAENQISTNVSDIKTLQRTVEELDLKTDKNFVFKQNVPASTWTVVHNLGKFPSITVVDSAGTVVVGEIVLQTTEQAVISFNAAFGGKAYCN